MRSKGPFLGADLSSGRAPRAGLVQDAACGTGAQRRLVLDETKHGAMLCPGWGISIIPAELKGSSLRRSLEFALHAAIAVVHEAGLADRAAITQRLLERVEHEVRPC